MRSRTGSVKSQKSEGRIEMQGGLAMDKYDLDKALAHGGGLKKHRRKYKLKPRFFIIIAILIISIILIFSYIYPALKNIVPEQLVTTTYWEQVLYEGD